MKKILLMFFSVLILSSFVFANPAIPTILSFVFPGGGQIYNGDYIKAGAIICAEILTAALIYRDASSAVEASETKIDIFALILAFSVSDAYVSAELKIDSTGGKNKKIQQ